MIKIYICGKVTGDPYYQAKFKAEAVRLYERGYSPVNPAALSIPENEPWNNAMRTAVREMLLCEGVSLLPDWDKSKGAKIEARLATELGLTVKDSVNWE